LFAQDFVINTPPFFSNNSIVRHVDNGVFITYNETNNLHNFILTDYWNAIVSTIQVPNSISINDMEVLDGYVFFCGNILGTRALFGYFDICDAFSGTDQIHYYLLPNSISTDIPTVNDQINNLRKIEISTCYGGVHLFITGDLTRTINYQSDYPMSCLLDIKLDISGSCSLCYIVDDNMILSFSDVAITNDWVITTFDKNKGQYSHQSEHSYFFIQRPQLMNECNFSLYMYDIESSHISVQYHQIPNSTIFNDSTHNLLIEKRVNNSFSTALSGVIYDNYVIMITTYKNVCQPVFRYYFPCNQYCTVKEFKGLSRVYEQGLVNVLQYGAPRFFYRIRENFSGSPSVNVEQLSFFQNPYLFGNWTSIDACPPSTGSINGGAILSGAIQNTAKLFWRELDDGYFNCSTITPIATRRVSEQDEHETIQFHLNHLDYLGQSEVGEILESIDTINTICH
jgi:hypothetical protein